MERAVHPMVRLSTLGSIAALCLSVGVAVNPSWIQAAPSCYMYCDWREDDPLWFDDDGHTANASADPNAMWPAEEWNLVGQAYRDGGVELWFHRGSTAAAHGHNDEPCT